MDAYLVASSGDVGTCQVEEPALGLEEKRWQLHCHPRSKYSSYSFASAKLTGLLTKSLQLAAQDGAFKWLLSSSFKGVVKKEFSSSLEL